MDKQEMLDRKTEKTARLNVVNKEIDDIKEEIERFELDVSDYEDEFRRALDECFRPLFSFSPSDIMEKMDPTMFSEELSGYVDGIDRCEDPEFQELEQKLEDLETEAEELEDEIAEIENEIDEI